MPNFLSLNFWALSVKLNFFKPGILPFELEHLMMVFQSRNLKIVGRRTSTRICAPAHNSSTILLWVGERPTLDMGKVIRILES